MSESQDKPVMDEEAQVPAFPGLLQALFLGPQALWTVLRAPVVLLFVFFCMTLPAFLLLSGYYENLNSVLAGNPLANGRGGLFLLQDYDRLHPGGHELPGLMQIVWTLMITFFAAGLLSTVGLGRRPRPGLTGFLSESGRLFFRSFRTLIPSLILILIWTGLFIVLLKPWVMGLDIVHASNMRAHWVLFGLNVLFLFGLGKILILRRLALARLVHTGRKSALLAWLWTLRYWMRHPFVTITAYIPLFLLFAGGALGAVYGLDALLARYFEQDSRPAYFMLAAQVFPLFYLAVNLASFLLARHLVAMDTAIREGGAAEPRVVFAPEPSKTEPATSVEKDAVGSGDVVSAKPAEANPDVRPSSSEEALAWEWTPEDSAKKEG